ncbi:hypothetical protein G7Y79_00066g095200 [Physcia stellaris]|nr:hypothetical protein G7Y79_00066g095200 [Physcia stellaris]
MTDNLSSFDTYTAPALHVNVLSNGISGQAVDSVASPIEEEEDYTIKCFCGFQLDDGNTVFCDRCETWQHIECYYFEDFRNGLAPDVDAIEHACVDCSPRQYDKKSASERQKDRFLPGERKIKKAPAKPIKKRAKPAESNATLANGYSHDGYDLSFAHERTSGSPRDHGPPTKRPKTSHRNSGSINLHTGPFASKSQSSRKISKAVTQHPPANEYFVEPPSPEFLCLYDDDPGDDPEAANVFNDIAITRSLSSWSRDVESLSRAANGLTPPQVFHRLNEPLDSKVMPQLHKEHRVDKSIEIGGRHPQWTSLSTENEMAKESIVGELRGRIGHMSDYCLDTANRWDYLRHPAPFVFFHPKLPIYIDTRQTGSTCRYLRRSCRPNVELRTILENGSDYRFIFIAKENLEAGAELTISWTPDEHIRRCQLSNPIKQEGTSDADAAYVSDWVQKVLSNFGGCACESPEQCGLVKCLRPRDLSSITNGNLINGKTPKGRNGHVKAVSTPEFGNGTNSRASSEGMKRTDDEDGDNSRSVSGSKTPTRCGSGVPSLEISDREKRKIAAVEKTFEQIEQERQQPVQRRKKRSSGGSNLNTPTVATSVRTPSQTQPPYGTNLWDQKQLGQNTPSVSQPNTPGLSARPSYVEASTSRKDQGSPVSKHSYTSFKRPNSNSKRSSHPNTPSTKSPPMRQNYVHRSVQTDADESDVWDHSAALQGHRRRRKVYISLGKRLLMRCQQDREQVEERRRISMEHTADTLPIETASEQMTAKSTNKTADGEPIDRDIEMKDTAEIVNSSLSDETSADRPVEKPRPPDEDSNPSESFGTGIKPPPPPSTISHTTVMSSSSKLMNGFRSAELRVQLPSAQHQSHDPASAPPMNTTVTPTVTRSPFPHTANSYPPLFTSAPSGAVAPSPVKKVSLGEYFSRRKTESQISTHGRTAGSSPTIAQSTIKEVGHADEEDKAASSETNGMVETPKEDTEPTMERKSSAP